MTKRSFLIVILVLPATVVLSRCLPQTAGSSTAKNGIYIGFQPDYDAAMKTALSQVGADIRKHPYAKTFYVRWSESRLVWVHLDEEFDRRDLLYNLDAKRISFGSGGGSSGLDRVSPTMIEAAAKAAHPYEALGKLGCTGWP